MNPTTRGRNVFEEYSDNQPTEREITPETIDNAIAIISKTHAGARIAAMFDGDDIPLGQNLAEWVYRVIKRLDNNSCFDTPDDFFEVFARAIELVEKHDATPDTLHLYLNDLTAETDETLEESGLEFLYLEVLRWFSDRPFLEITPDGKRGIYHREWNDELISCLPCPCVPFDSHCECDIAANIDEDDPDCRCHLYPHRNLYRLIYPITKKGDFDYLKRRLKLLADSRERLRLLIEEKTAFEQTFGVRYERTDEFGMTWPDFSAQCDLEIGKLKELIALEQQGETNGTSDESVPKKRGLTRQLAMMLLDELFPSLKNAPNTAKAEFLWLMTGMSAKGFANKWSDYQRANPKSLEADRATVAKWKKRLKISD